jgi:hypothetical protein
MLSECIAGFHDHCITTRIADEHEPSAIFEEIALFATDLWGARTFQTAYVQLTIALAGVISGATTSRS